MAISENLRSLRRAAKMTQAILAARSGVSQQLISAIENGQVAGTNSLPALASALGVQVSEIDPRFEGSTNGDFGGGTIDFIPIVPWESVPVLSEAGLPTEMALLPTIPMVGLAPGALIALRVSGTDMQRVSPPESIIIANLADTRLISGKYYIVESAETGDILYRQLSAGAGVPLFVAAPAIHRATERKLDRPLKASRVFARVYRTLCDL